MDISKLNAFINENKNVSPYFLLLLTTNGTNIMVQAANQTADALTAATAFTKNAKDPLTTMIETYIGSSELNTIYNSNAINDVAPASNDTLIDQFLAKQENSGKTYTELNFANLVDTNNNLINLDSPVNADILKLASNTDEVKAVITTLSGGGSRSRKNRRRHKRRHKNTKRRNRK
jgi:hypothetical protein